jgi:hypothetical protein
LSNGVRELMVLHSTLDAAKSWQLDEIAGHEEAFQFADNLFLYAIDKQNLLEKGKTYLVTADEKTKTNARIKMARIQYDGNWDPEPAGWRRMSAILHNLAYKLEIFPLKLGEGKLGDGTGVGVRVAHLTGTTKVKLTPEQRKELKAFASGNGTLVVDCAGGSGEFAESIENELTEIFGSAAGDQLKQPLPAEDRVFNLNGGKIEDFGYRPFARKILGSLKGPQLKVITVNNRPAVYYSREDLSAGLVGEPMDGIIGYNPATATAIMRNLLLVGGFGDKATAEPAKAPAPPPVAEGQPPPQTTKPPPTTKPATTRPKGRQPKKPPATKPS